mgnify:CR=1 FL=1
MSNSPSPWPTPGPIRGVIFDIHSTLVDQGDADHWLDAALAVVPHPMSASERAELVAFLDRIWEGARISDPQSTRDLSFEDHSRVFHELIAAGPGVDRPLADVLYDVMLDTWHVYDDTLPTLRALKDAGLRGRADRERRVVVHDRDHRRVLAERGVGRRAQVEAEVLQRAGVVTARAFELDAHDLGRIDDARLKAGCGMKSRPTRRYNRGIGRNTPVCR